MRINVLLFLDPRCPEAIVYINRNGFGFSEQVNYCLQKKCRIRIGPRKLPYRASIKLAHKLYSGILPDANKLNGKEFIFTEHYVPEGAGPWNSVLLEVEDSKSEKVMSFIENFVMNNNLLRNGKPTATTETLRKAAEPETTSRFSEILASLSFA